MEENPKPETAKVRLFWTDSKGRTGELTIIELDFPDDDEHGIRFEVEDVYPKVGDLFERTPAVPGPVEHFVDLRIKGRMVPQSDGRCYGVRVVEPA